MSILLLMNVWEVYMKVILSIITIILLSTLVRAEINAEVGFLGLTSWTTHRVYQNPEGIGIFLEKSLSQKVSLR